MLNEVYAPKTVADLAWSRQKATALSTFIRSVRGTGSNSSTAGNTHDPRILLLYGPPGCGKLESLKVLLQEDISPPSGSSTRRKSADAPPPVMTPTSFNIFHTCEATVQAYGRYLQQVLSQCSGQLLGSTLQLTTSGAAERNDIVRQQQHQPLQNADVTASAVAHHAHIVKFYGEPASHPLHRCTVLFLRQYEELRARALWEEQEQQHQQRQRTGSSARPAPSLLDHLRRNPIFFIHTTHDSHNDKLDLGTTFPSVLLQSSVVELFHCTAITEINLKKRLKDVLEREATRRKELHERQHNLSRAPATPAASARDVTDVDELFSGEIASTSPATKRRSAVRKVGGTKEASSQLAKAAAAAAAAVSVPYTDVVDRVALEAIAAGSQGDIRQALLQIQWTALLSPREEVTPQHTREDRRGQSASSHDAADVIWARLQKRRCLAECSAGADFDAAAAQGTEVTEVIKNEEEEVVLISSSSSESSSQCHATQSLSAGLTQDRTQDNNSNRDEEEDGTSEGQLSTRKRARSPVDDMLALLESQMNHADVLPVSTSMSSRSGKRKAPRPEGDDVTAAADAAPPSTAANGSAPPSSPPASQAVEHRSVLPTTRDEYLGLSHATGRLLTQKYSIDEVLDILNVPPRKVLDYLTNNQLRFFAEDQVSPYAACAAAASVADAMRTSEFEGGSAAGVSAAALRERRQLADRTSAGESVGNAARLLDVIALHAYHQTYLVEQTAVRAPPGFAAMEPPPFLKMAYPRIRDAVTAGVGFRGGAMGGGGYGSGPGDDASLQDVGAVGEEEWTQRFLIRLDSAVNTPSSPAGSSSGSAGASNRRRAGALSSYGVSQAASLTATRSSPRIQVEEVDIVREGLPDLMHRCGCTESAVMDYYALAPFIVLEIPPPAPSASQLHTVAGAISLPASRGGNAHVHNTLKLEGSANSPSKVGVHERAEALPLPVAPSASAPPAGPRRTVFKFSATTTPTPSQPRADSVTSSTPPPPPPPPQQQRSLAVSATRRDARRPCTLLQLKILQRGRDAAVATLRNDHFALVAAEDMATEGVMGTTGDVEERPWMPEGDDIEDD